MTHPQQGVLYLVPMYLSSSNDKNFLAPMILDILTHCKHFIVENVRTARRYISSLELGVDIESLKFYELNKHFDIKNLEELTYPLKAGHQVGLLSESGLPGVADPGNIVISYAHQHNLRVTPLPGASSIILSLISSGFNGQQFTFHGYLPIDEKARENAITRMEKTLYNGKYTQVFMETPYRNQKLFDTLLKTLGPKTLLSIGTDITGQLESIATRTVSEWHNNPTRLEKLPTIYAVGEFPNG
ncbi:MAG: SAM-dependent methyltransferase [Cyclobacteriaceae bacterium]|nr:SAM-dependent methyltransferase [Cyclobacteriaceae bacterium HetDA_MAG_MS6]